MVVSRNHSKLTASDLVKGPVKRTKSNVSMEDESCHTLIDQHAYD